jgi:hypothetical protein
MLPMEGESMGGLHAAIAFVGAYGAELAVGLGTSLAAFGATAWVLVRLPEDYLERPDGAPFWPERPRWMQIAGKTGKNLLGIAIVATGAVLAVPGVPGPGVLTVLMGAMLVDIPGKRRVERRILGAPRVLTAVNRHRALFKRPPLRMRPEHDGAALAAR